MSFIILTRNPGSGDLHAIMTVPGEAEYLAEYETHDAAERAAVGFPCCKAWGWQVMEVDLE